MKKPIFYWISFFSLVTIIFLVVSHIGSAQPDQSPEAMITYRVTTSNNNTATWFNSDFTQSFHYHVENGSEINLNITDLDDPTSEISLRLGNLTRTGILDDEAESALALGYWKLPHVFGFVASTNWEEVKANITALSLNSSTFHDDLKLRVDQQLRDVVNIGLFDGFQQTNILYDKELGFLIKAYSTFGNFELEFELESIDASRFSQTDTNSSPVLPLVFFLTLHFLVRMRKAGKNWVKSKG